MESPSTLLIFIVIAVSMSLWSGLFLVMGNIFKRQKDILSCL